MSIHTDTSPTVADLVAQIQGAAGGMRTTESLAYGFEIPETAIAPLTAQARDLGLIVTERDPRTLSPMHRLTAAGRAFNRPAPAAR